MATELEQLRAENLRLHHLVAALAEKNLHLEQQLAAKTAVARPLPTLWDAEGSTHGFHLPLPNEQEPPNAVQHSSQKMQERPTNGQRSFQNVQEQETAVRHSFPNTQEHVTAAGHEFPNAQEPAEAPEHPLPSPEEPGESEGHSSPIAQEHARRPPHSLPAGNEPATPHPLAFAPIEPAALAALPPAARRLLAQSLAEARYRERIAALNVVPPGSAPVERALKQRALRRHRYTHVTAAAQVLLGVCAAPGQPLGYAAVRALTGFSDTGVYKLLRSLLRAGLLHRKGVGRYDLTEEGLALLEGAQG